mgnify:CR=1 FL=1
MGTVSVKSGGLPPQDPSGSPGGRCGLGLRPNSGAPDNRSLNLVTFRIEGPYSRDQGSRTCMIGGIGILACLHGSWPAVPVH